MGSDVVNKVAWFGLCSALLCSDWLGWVWRHVDMCCVVLGLSTLCICLYRNGLVWEV